MNAIQVNVPEEVLISLKETPQTVERELLLAAAVKLFEMGKLSSGRAAQLAGMSRVAFLLALERYPVSPFQLTEEQLERDVTMPDRVVIVDTFFVFARAATKQSA